MSVLDEVNGPPRALWETVVGCSRSVLDESKLQAWEVPHSYCPWAGPPEVGTTPGVTFADQCPLQVSVAVATRSGVGVPYVDRDTGRLAAIGIVNKCATV